MKSSEWKLLSKITDDNNKNEGKNDRIQTDSFIDFNIKNIFNSSLNIEHVLCVGEVQSGKTANIESIIEYGIESNYKLIIIFSGINKILFNQTNSRIKRRLMNKKKIRFVENLNHVCLSLDIKENDSVIVSILKGVIALNDIFNIVDDLNWTREKVLIIDDECDFASINISRENYSKTYKQISELYTRFHNIKLISFTGTPFANLMSSSSEILKPDRIVNLINYNDYYGIHFFNKSDNYIVIDLSKNYIEYEFISKVFFSWILLTSFALIDDCEFKSELVLNIEINNSVHLQLLNFAKDSLDFWHKEVVFKKFSIKKQIKSVSLEYLKMENHDVNYDLLIEKIRFVLEKLKNEKDSSFILLNSKSDSSNFRSGNNQFCIIVGGYMISRGFTFENLTLELILNAPENKIAIDTLLQRCRWFGNRKNRLKYLRIIMNQKIADALKKAEQYVDIFEPGISTTNIDQIRGKIRKLDLVNNEVESTNAIKRK